MDPASSVELQYLPWHPVFFSRIEDFPNLDRSLEEHHYRRRGATTGEKQVEMNDGFPKVCTGDFIL